MLFPTLLQDYYAEILNSMKLGDIPDIEIKGRHFMKKINFKGKQCTVIASIPLRHPHSAVVDVFTLDCPPLDTRDLGIRLQEFEADLKESHNMSVNTRQSNLQSLRAQHACSHARCPFACLLRAGITARRCWSNV